VTFSNESYAMVWTMLKCRCSPNIGLGEVGGIVLPHSPKWVLGLAGLVSLGFYCGEY